MEPTDPTPAASEDDKAKSKSVALTPALWKQVDAVVEKDYGDNRSAFFRELVEAKFAASATSVDSRPLIEFARRNHPGLVPDLEALLTAKGSPRFSQQKIATRLVEMLIDLLRVQQRAEEQIYSSLANEDAIQAARRRERELSSAMDAVHDRMLSGVFADVGMIRAPEKHELSPAEIDHLMARETEAMHVVKDQPIGIIPKIRPVAKDRPKATSRG